MSNATVTVFPFEASVASTRAVSDSRLNWVDIARGITILLVVIGHAGLSKEYQLLLQPFRLPLFYFTSGYLFNYERHRDSLGQYLTARVRRLVLPYFCTAFLFYGICYVLDYRTLGHTEFNAWKQFVAIFLANGMVVSDPQYVIWFDLALWFLGCMAVSTMIFVALIGLFKNEKTFIPMILTSVGIAALGRLAADRWGALPWSADVAMEAQFFFVMGFLLRQYGAQFTDPRMLVFFGFLYLILAVAGDHTDMNRRIYPDFSQMCLAGLAGTYIVYFISKQLSQLAETDTVARWMSKPWQFLGRNTMVIMAFHMGGNYLRELIELVVLGRKDYANPEGFWPSFICMAAVSLMAIALLNGVKPLRRIYYK